MLDLLWSHVVFNHKTVVALILISLSSLLVSGCGGADGAAETLDPGSSLPEGVESNARLSFPWVMIGEDSYLAASQEVFLGPRGYLADGSGYTGDAGLTGRGVWIGVIDDFSTRKDSVYRFPAIARQKLTKASGSASTSAATNSTCTLPHEWRSSWTHGDLVQQIAGGTKAEQNLPVSLTVPNESTNATCASKFYGSLSLALESRLLIRSISGVASAASIQKYPVVLGATGNNVQQLGTILGHLGNALSDDSKVIRVVNLSLGSDIGASAQSRQTIVDEAIKTFPIVSSVDAVITVAAGNSGLPCDQQSLVGCNLLAVAMVSQDSTRGSSIVVGALEGSGKAERVATYSTFPGYLRDRFLWALGDAVTHRRANGEWPQGTSFAAPRVAGAAALLRQKYPGLTSAQVADLLLDSANRDMDNDGLPDFEGASLTWGRGRLDLAAALKLASLRFP